jgi:6-phosphofructokinase 1
VLLSEGAAWVGHSIKDYGAADAYGHKKKQNIAEAFSDRIKATRGEDTVVVDLTYDLRSGEPDFLDKMVATTFATMAFECIGDRAGGRMMAIRDGCYTDTDIPDPALGPRRIDVETMYDQDRFRPNYETKKSLPIFMMRA